MNETKADRRKRAGLVDEGAYLSRSLEDLDREHEAGDLDHDDHVQLRERYLARAEQIASELAELDELRLDEAAGMGEPPSTGGGTRHRTGSVRGWLAERRHRLLLGWSAAGCFVVAAALVGLGLAGVAPFGQSPPATLTVAAQIQTELAEASVLATDHEVVQAIDVYGRVLQLDPTQPEALADGGWLIRLAGLSGRQTSLVTDGDQQIAAAVRIAPGYALARAYDGVALFEDSHSAAGAVREFSAMLAAHPSAKLVASVRTTASQAFQAAGDSVPPAFAATGA